MVPSRDLAARFEAYSDWRRRLSAGVSGAARLAAGAGPGRRAGRPARPATAGTPPPGQAGRRVRRRVLARQVRADQRDLLRRLRPAAAAVVGRAHDDVPDRAPVRRRRGRRRSGCCRSRRALKDATVAEFKNYADEWVTFSLDLASAEKMGEALVPGVAGEARPGRARAQVRPLRRRRGRHPGRARARRRGQRRHPVLAPRGHQLPASAAAAGPRDPRHAGPERDRHRARADAQPAAQRARAAVHPRGRRRRDQDRPRGVEPAPGRRRSRHARPAASSS